MVHFRNTFLGHLLLLLTLQFVTCSEQNKTVLTKDMTFKLNSGDLMPLIGFGTYQVQGDELIKSVLDSALAANYRLIDSAAVYGNEASIGRALKELLPKYNLTRRDIFITSKLGGFPLGGKSAGGFSVSHSIGLFRINFQNRPIELDTENPPTPNDQGTKAYVALERSLRNLDCDYLDLYLIHWPGAQGVRSEEKNNSVLRDESWQQLVKGVKNGLTKNIGVSNYNVQHMSELLKNNHGIKPAVNQVEWHPAYYQPELSNLLKKEGILLQAYSSLGGSNNPDLLNNSKVTKIAAKLGKSSAQILLRWALQQNIGIIPKARSKKHIDQNIDLNFVIPDEDMKILDSFPQVKYAWDPDTIA